MVASVPGRAISATPIGTRQSPPSGTGPLMARYIFLCSRNSTGSGSSRLASSRPFRSAGVEGMTTFSPGTWAKSDSTDCEWYSAPWTPPPYGARTTIGTQKSPLLR